MPQIVTDERTGEVHEFPDQATPEQIRAALTRPRGSLVDAIIDAATFGLSDEVKAAGEAAGGWLARQFGIEKPGRTMGQDYEQQLAIERNKLADLSLAQRIIGGAVGGLVAAPQAAGNLVAQAAGMGAAYGAGSGEGGLENRALSAGVGAGTGVIAAKVIPPVVRGVTGAVRTFTAPQAAAEERAVDRIQRALARGGIDPSELPSRMAAAGPGATVAEGMGGQGQRLARAVANTPGESGPLAQKVLGERSAQMGEDITQGARALLGDVNAYGAADAIAARQKQIAGPLYQQAYDQPVPFTEHLEDLLNRPATRKALRAAQEIADNEGDVLPQWFVKLGEKDGKITADDIQEVPSTKLWHYIRQGLDDQLEKYRSPITGKLDLDNAGSKIQGIRRALDAELKSLNPTLAQADATFGGMAKAKDAMAKGREFMRRRPEEIARLLGGLNDSEKEFYRLGVAQAIDDRMSDVARGNSAVSRLADVPSFETKVRAIFPSDESAQSFIDLLSAKRQQQAFKNMVLSGSRTTPLAEDIADLGTSRLETAIDASRVVRGDTSALGRLANKMLYRFQAGYSEQTRNAIGAALMRQDLDPAMAQALSQKGGPPVRQSLQRGAVQSTLPLLRGPGQALTDHPQRNDNLMRSGQLLMQQGAPPAAAAGIVGNLMHESGGNPRAVGDGGTSVGMAQWHADRAAALDKFAQDTGGRADSVETQIGFLMHELKQDPSLKADLWAAPTAAKAADIFQRRFERPAQVDPQRSATADRVLAALLRTSMPSTNTAVALASAPPPSPLPRPSQPGAVTQAVLAKFYGTRS